ncbi:MAG: hypothetical protein ACK5KU_05220 [Beutenbergiaceae bacterium]
MRFPLYAIGLGLISIGAAGPVWGLYTAPPEEPLVGIFAEIGYPQVFSWVFFIAYAATGVLALLTPSVLNQMAGPGAVANKRDFIVAKGDRGHGRGIPGHGGRGLLHPHWNGAEHHRLTATRSSRTGWTIGGAKVDWAVISSMTLQVTGRIHLGSNQPGGCRCEPKARRLGGWHR